MGLTYNVNESVLYYLHITRTLVIQNPFAHVQEYVIYIDLQNRLYYSTGRGIVTLHDAKIYYTI